MRYKQDRRWRRAIQAIISWELTGYDVWKVGCAFPPTGSGEAEHEYVLLNYPNEDGEWGKALEWAKQNGYENTNPREAFAVFEKFPDLVKELRWPQKELRIVSTTYANAKCLSVNHCVNGVCYAYLAGTTYGAYVNFPGNCCDGHTTCCWYLFRKPKKFSIWY